MSRDHKSEFEAAGLEVPPSGVIADGRDDGWNNFNKGVSLAKGRHLSPGPKGSHWPFPWEPVGLSWAKAALEFGNPAILRKPKVDNSLFNPLERLLHPATAANELRLRLYYRGRGRPVEKRPNLRALNLAELADLLDPPTPAQLWQLKFVKPKGSPGNPTQYWDQHSLCMEVRSALLRERKVHLAVATVQ
jgi:hypothetical protein